MKRVSIVVLVALAAAAGSGGFQTVRALRSVPERDEIAAVHLDEDIYRATRLGFPDVRVFDDRDRPVAFLLEPFHKTSLVWHERTVPAKVDSLTPVNEGSIEVIVESPLQEQDPDWIEFRTPLVNFEKQVRVESRQRGDWRTVVPSATIYDYSRYMDVRQTRVLLPDQAPRGRYRIRLEDVQEIAASAFVELTRRTGGGEPDEETIRGVIRRRDFRIDSVLFGYRISEEKPDVPVTETAQLPIIEITEDTDEKLTRLIVETGRRPVRKLTLDVADRNIGRQVRVEAKEPAADSAQRWRPIASERIRRLDFRGVREEKLEIDCPVSRSEHLRITILNADAPPLEVTAVTGEWTTHRLIFLADAGGTYRIAYGSPEAEAPHVDTAVIQRIVQMKRPLIRTFDLQPVDQPTAAPRQHLLLRVLNHRATLIALTLGGVLILAGAIAHVLKGL